MRCSPYIAKSGEKTDYQMKPTIVILAFNRVKSLERLLNSISRADYPFRVRLVISLEGGADQKVIQAASDFSHEQIDTEIIERATRLGLREHVLTCGDLSIRFGAVIILEDDLLVDRYFYHYALAAVSHYQDAIDAAGISLYSYQVNEYCGAPFTPMYNGYSTFPMQVPSSWGQVWTKLQWSSFREWYDGKTCDDLSLIKALPEQVKNWPKSSWKKYFAAYLVEKKRYMIFPYQSYSTNCSDEGGTHLRRVTNIYQTPLACYRRPSPTFSFCGLESPEVAYDAFFEPSGEAIFRSLGLSGHDVEIDTQGIKPLDLLLGKPYSLTIKSTIQRQARTTFPVNFRPVEQNFEANRRIQSRFHIYLSESVTLSDKEEKSNILPRYSYLARLDIDNLRTLLVFLGAGPRMILRRIGLYRR